MFISVITDCISQDDIIRQETRLASLFNAPISIVGVSSDFSAMATYEAAGCLVDALDGAEGREGVVIANVAPRGEAKKDGHNGTAFCYFYYGKTLVISTLRGNSLSLVKKLGLTSELKVTTVEDVTNYMHEKGEITEQLRDYIQNTQFRSYDYAPRLAKWIYDGHDLPHTIESIDVISDIPDTIWYVDAFGNTKSTILRKDHPDLEEGQRVSTPYGELTFYERLKNVPKGENAIIQGSSGIEDKRFMEIVAQMVPGSAAKTLGVAVGDDLTISY